MTAVSDPTEYAVRCGVCGRGLPARAVFCSFCGSELRNERAAVDVSGPPAAAAGSVVADADGGVSGETFEDRLRLLKRLVEDDLITREDYEERKRAVLDAMMGDT